MSFPLNFRNRYFVDVSPDDSVESWVPLAAGISSVEPSFEDETDDTAYYDGEGFNSEEVTGVRASLSFTGHRDDADEGQNYIASMAFEVGSARKTRLKWEQTNGTTVTGPVTISNIKTTGGDANTKQEFEFTATFNGKPTVTPTTP